MDSCQEVIRVLVVLDGLLACPVAGLQLVPEVIKETLILSLESIYRVDVHGPANLACQLVLLQLRPHRAKQALQVATVFGL